jgi:EmrB/QacA subfamily drug resistance transporter
MPGPDNVSGVTGDTAVRQLSRWTLWFGGLAFFTCYLGQTVLGVIQPTIAAELNLSASQAQWVVNSFFLTLALFAAPGGRLGDYYGHRQALLVALLVFAAGSLSAAVSQGFLWLVASIGVAGIGAATLYPASAAMIANRVPLERRGDALGKYSAIGASVFVIGPVLAGVLTDLISWRALFGLQLLIGAGLALMGWRKVESRPVGTPEPFDVGGLLVLLAGLTALLVALMQALTWGWDSAPTLVLFAVGILVIAAFCVLELRKAHPLLDVGLMRRQVMRGIVLSMFLAQFVITGFIIYAATYFQHVMDYGPLLAALALVPSMLAAPIFNIIAGRVTDRIGARVPSVIGFVATAVAFGWLAMALDNRSYLLILPGLLVLSMSFSPMFTSLLTALSNAVGAQERGDANALVLTVRWVGAAAGTMVLGVIIHAGTTSPAVPTAGPYSTAFTVLAVTSVAGALVCAVMLRERAPDLAPKHDRVRHHF